MFLHIMHGKHIDFLAQNKQAYSIGVRNWPTLCSTQQLWSTLAALNSKVEAYAQVPFFDTLALVCFVMPPGLSKTLMANDKLKPLRTDTSLHRTDTSTEQLTETYKLTGETGSYRYMAPEVFRHEPYNLKVRKSGDAHISWAQVISACD